MKHLRLFIHLTEEVLLMDNINSDYQTKIKVVTFNVVLFRLIM